MIRNHRHHDVPFLPHQEESSYPQSCLVVQEIVPPFFGNKFWDEDGDLFIGASFGVNPLDIADEGENNGPVRGGDNQQL